MEAEVQANLVREMGLPIHQSKGWLKLIGILSILYGAMMVLTIVGIVIAWLPIWMGVLLLQSASTIEHAQITGDKVALYRSLSKIKMYFTITGILGLIGIIVTGMMLFFGVLGAFFNAIRGGGITY